MEVELAEVIVRPSVPRRHPDTKVLLLRLYSQATVWHSYPKNAANVVSNEGVVIEVVKNRGDKGERILCAIEPFVVLD